MNNFVFDLSDEDDLWILKYCLNLMSDSFDFLEKVENLFLEGESIGEVDWGIHKYNKLTSIEFGVDEFEGYRAYMGEEEHLLGHDKDIEVYFNEKVLKRLLEKCFIWYIKKYPENKEKAIMIKNKCMMINYTPLMIKLNKAFPHFSKLDNLDDNEYIYFGNFTSYMLDLMSLYTLGKISIRSYFIYKLENEFKNKEKIEKQIINFFNFINDLYANADSNTKDILNTCVFEAMVGFDFTYELSKKYFSKELFSYYTKKFSR